MAFSAKRTKVWESNNIDLEVSVEDFTSLKNDVRVVVTVNNRGNSNIYLYSWIGFDNATGAKSLSFSVKGNKSSTQTFSINVQNKNSDVTVYVRDPWIPSKGPSVDIEGGIDGTGYFTAFSFSGKPAPYNPPQPSDSVSPSTILINNTATSVSSPYVIDPETNFNISWSGANKGTNFSRFEIYTEFYSGSSTVANRGGPWTIDAGGAYSRPDNFGNIRRTNIYRITVYAYDGDNKRAARAYAYVKVRGYQITYNANGGSGAPAAQEKAVGVNINLSSGTPSLSGKRLYGWGANATTGTLYQPGGVYSQDADVTMVAIWENAVETYNVIVNPNGGTWRGSSNETTVVATVGNYLTLEPPTRPGYTFAGWACQNSQTSDQYSAGTGLFTSVPNKYIYNGSGTNNSTLSLVTMDTASGFLAGGLKMLRITEPGTSDRSVGFYKVVQSAANQVYQVNFVAKAPIGRYFIYVNTSIGDGGTFEWLTPNAGTGVWQTYSLKITAGSTGTFSYIGYITVAYGPDNVDPYSTPYAFQADIAYISTAIYGSANISSYTPKSGLTRDVATALWIENDYTIQYDTDSSNIVLSLDQIYTAEGWGNDRQAKNATVASYNRSPYKTGVGAYYGTGPCRVNYRPYFRIQAFGDESNIEQIEYLIEYDTDGGSTVQSDVYTGNKYYSFTGWTLSGMDNSTHVFWDRSKSPAQNTYFTDETYTINYQGTDLELYNLRQSPGDVQVKYNWEFDREEYPTFNLPSAPTKEHYTFTGWYDENGNKVGNAGDPYTLRSNQTLYAQWMQTSATITFNPSGGVLTGSNTATMVYDTAFSSNTKATKKGYALVGWDYTENVQKAGILGNDNCDIKGSTISKTAQEVNIDLQSIGTSATLYAQWVKCAYVDDGNSWKTAIPIIYTNSWNRLEPYVYDGSGWK